MRIVSALIGLSLFASVVAHSQAPSVHTPREAALESYSKHRDTRFGHDHFYPDRGALIRVVSAGATVVNYAGLAYRFSDGIWYERRGPAFMVVVPPIGLVVASLPTFATVLAHNGQTYIYCNDTYYRPRPDLNGYEVANDPLEATFQAAAETGSAAAVVTSDSTSADSMLPVAAAPVAVAFPLDDSANVSAPAAVEQPAAPPLAATAPQPSEPVMTGSASVMAPAAQAPATSAATRTSRGVKAVITPVKGQSDDQQARDRYECYRFAVAQSGVDPMRSGSVNNSGDYDRAQSACFEGRGYSVQ